MSIDEKIARKLLKEIMDNINYEVNINIMNEYGEIIASGDEKRIGKIHLGALDVIKNAKSMEYFDYIDNDTESSKPGVNIPLFINNEIIGVVGVTGNPKEIKLIANMVKMLTEILIRREMDIDKQILKQTTLNNYIYKIISKDCYNYISSINIWAENNHYSFNIERNVCLLKIENNGKYDMYKISEYLINKLQNIKYFYKQDIITYIGNKQFIIIKSFDSKEKIQDKKKIINYFFTSLREEINIDINFSAMCGCIVNNLEDIHKSFEQANFLFNYITHTNNNTYFIEDYILEYIILNEGNFSSSMILKNTLNIINKNAAFKETIITMSNCDMNINKTCEKLFMHRNTVLYRMKKIKEILGLDPINNHMDRIKFYIISTMLKK